MALIDPTLMSEETSTINEDEIINNFATLIRKSEKAKNNQNLRSVISKLEDNIKDNEKYLLKMFLINTQTGVMMNTDNAPNVSFRIDTINNIFDSISSSLQGLSLSEEVIDKIFFDAGVKCGTSFARTFNSSFLENTLGVYDTPEKIREWCAFDSSVGWGKLEYDEGEKCIKIKNNFQAKPFEVGGFPKNCSLFKGYISGVLSVLYGKEINIEEDAQCENCPKKCDSRVCSIKLKF